MSNGVPVTRAEVELALAHDQYRDYAEAGGTRSVDAWRKIRSKARKGTQATVDAVPVAPPAVLPQLDEVPSWREINEAIGTVQGLRKRASRSRREVALTLEVDQPVCLLALGDTHIGSIATDHELLEAITDEILATPNLYVCLLGDILDMAVKLRGVAEVQGSVLPTEMQYVYAASWLAEIAPRVLCATWGNHDVEREEQLLGSARLGALYADKRIVYHGGIGHVDLTVGSTLYRLAVSHHYQGRSIYNPVHGAQRYTTLVAHDREIVLSGDSHVPGVLQWNHGTQHKIAVNTGTLQTGSAYAGRYFSLFTSTAMPCVALWPDEWRAVPFWSLSSWRAAMG